MFHAYNFASGNELFDGVTKGLMYGTKAELDVSSGSDVQLHNVIAGVDSFTWEEDIKNYWMTRARWHLMIRQYLNPESLDVWLDSIERKLSKGRRGIAVMRTNTIGARTNSSGAWRTWGACILSLSYRSLPRPQLTMHSRSCYFGFLSVLDLTLAHVAARMIAERVGLHPADMRFLWHVESAQLHAFKSMPFLFADEQREEVLYNFENDANTPPGLRNARNTLDKFLDLDKLDVPYDAMPYAQSKRARRRLHTEVYGYDYGERFVGEGSENQRFKPLPSLLTSDLTFDALHVRSFEQEDPARLVEMVDE
jgi:hypothetical protein